jgi:sugar phosphate isomerase/epimerase
MNRREFIARAGVGLGALGLGTRHLVALPQVNLSGCPVYIFSKHLQFLGYAEMAQAAAEIGFDGIDLTVRPGGHVLPERVARDLPKAVKAIRETGLAVDTISTGITQSDDPRTQDVLEAAKDNGIRQYRIGMRNYELSQPIEEQLESWITDIQELGRLNTGYGLMGAVQNHSRFYLGGLIWDLWEAIKSSDPTNLGCHFDPCHAVAEAAISWPVGFHLLKSRITALIVKDFDFTQSERGLNRSWRPLGEGKVPWERFWPMVQEAGLNVPVILHMEYGDRKNPEQVIEFLKRDLQTLRAMLAGTWQRA